MELREEIIDTPTDDGEMAVLVTQPAAPPSDADTWPVVLMFHDGPGIREATAVFMRELASEGYVVVTPDLYHRDGRLLNAVDTDPGAGRTTREMMTGWIASLADDRVQHDGDRALGAAGVAPDTPIATIGFCLGARAVFRRMMAEPDRVVAGAMWHPSFLADDEPDSPHRTAGDLTQPMYLAIGDADEVQSIAMHRRFLDAVEPLDHVTVEIFEGADHGFTWPGQPNHHEAAAAGAWAASTTLFSDAFSSQA